MGGNNTQDNKEEEKEGREGKEEESIKRVPGEEKISQIPHPKDMAMYIPFPPIRRFILR